MTGNSTVRCLNPRMKLFLHRGPIRRLTFAFGGFDKEKSLNQRTWKCLKVSGFYQLPAQYFCFPLRFLDSRWLFHSKGQIISSEERQYRGIMGGHAHMHLQGERARSQYSSLQNAAHSFCRAKVIPHWKLKIHTWNRSKKEALTSKLV